MIRTKKNLVLSDFINFKLRDFIYFKILVVIEFYTRNLNLKRKNAAPRLYTSITYDIKCKALHRKKLFNYR